MVAMGILDLVDMLDSVDMPDLVDLLVILDTDTLPTPTVPLLDTVMVPILITAKQQP